MCGIRTPNPREGLPRPELPVSPAELCRSLLGRGPSVQWTERINSRTTCCATRIATAATRELSVRSADASRRNSVAVRRDWNSMCRYPVAHCRTSDGHRPQLVAVCPDNGRSASQVGRGPSLVWMRCVRGRGKGCRTGIATVRSATKCLERPTIRSRGFFVRIRPSMIRATRVPIPLRPCLMRAIRTPIPSSARCVCLALPVKDTSASSIPMTHAAIAG